jgi:hypothetical protein
MRTILALALALSFAGAASAEDPAKAVNTVCPASGKDVDPKVAPIKAKDKDGKEVEIGVCCNKCAAKVKADPAKYVAAAEANKKL